MSKQTLKPVMIGCYSIRGETRFLPVSRFEMERAEDAWVRVIQSFGFAHGRYVLTISRSREAPLIIPFERAEVACHLKVCNADDTIFEAGRVEMFVRRFDVAAIAGMSNAILDGLINAGHDPHALLAGRVVWARPGAYERLIGNTRITVRRWSEIGPSLAFECSEGKGVHVDALEWKIEERDGQILLSSRMQRAEDIQSLATGVTAPVIWEPCHCGNADPRVAVA